MSYLNMNNEKLLHIVVELNTLLADYHIYHQKSQSFKWSLIGNDIFNLHSKFEYLHKDAQTKIDQIAERILILGFHPLSKLSDYLEISSLIESNSFSLESEMISEILKDHKTILNQMSKIMEKADEASDLGTMSLIGSFIRDLEKSSWMLDAWCKTTSNRPVKDRVAS